MDWQTLLQDEKQKPYFRDIMAQLDAACAAGKTVYPPKKDIYNAVKLTDFNAVKVVILGQDPYHGPGQAHGLCFSVRQGVPKPPSLDNIFKELNADLGIEIPSDGDLTHWAQSGVLLLNTVLTVEAGLAQSHQHFGWQAFTDVIIKGLSDHREHLVFMLWGSHAQKKRELIDQNKHTILTTTHPSPLSAYRGFLGCRHFSKANQALLAHDTLPVDWSLPKHCAA